MKKTKKIIISFLAFFMFSILVLSGCSQPLTNAPIILTEMEVKGDVLIYEDYIYFSNAFKSYENLKRNDNDVGKVVNEALYRVSLKDKCIEYDETNMPQNVELVLSKVIGSEHSFLYGVDDYIYFTSPNTHKGMDGSDKFELTTYFKIKTDGTGLSEIYTTNKVVSKQTILKIENKHYLVFVEGTSIFKIELGKSNKPVEIASNIQDAVFAEKYTTEGDQFAYYTTDIEDLNTTHGVSGTYLYKVDITGISENSKLLNSSSYSEKTITPISVKNGIFYFTMNDTDTKTYYYSFFGNDFSQKIKISPPIDITVNGLLSYKSVTQNVIYHIFSISTENVYKTYCLRNGNIEFKEDNVLVTGEIKILFTHNDYLYYAVENEGIYRISILNKNKQTVLLCEDFKTSNICFDGKYIYFYKTSEVNETGIYYMHRTEIRNAEIGQDSPVELVGFLDEKDMPEITEE